MTETLSDITSVTVGRARIHVINPDDAARLVCEIATTGRRGQLVVTPNISHIVLLERDEQFRAAYDHAALAVPDGWPVARVMQLRSRHRQARVNGTELVLNVTAHAAERGLSVAFVGGATSAAQLCAERLSRQLPSLRIALVDAAPAAVLACEQGIADLLARIDDAQPDILFLGLGAPKQEIVATTQPIAAGVVLGIGSALELIAGVRRRAPAMWRRLGLEWLHRLLQEPRRLAPRYLRDAPLFVWIVMRQQTRRRGS